jgi:integrin alpha FG-GAP repeat containing protein 1
MIERSGKQDQGRITFIKNGAFRDAFFLKALGKPSFPRSLRYPDTIAFCTVLDGACQGDMCVSTSDGTLYSVSYGNFNANAMLKLSCVQPYGSNLPGGNLKFAILDPAGQRVPAQGRPPIIRGRLGYANMLFVTVPQMPQTAYHALQAPYAFFGLGRTNNYIEVGSNRVNMADIISASKY